MGEIPLALLLHTVTVEAYRSWGVYDSPRTLKCTVDEKMAASRGQAGVQQVTNVTLYARKNADCPPGSKVTLRDGRKGYAVATLRYDGGGLPTPDYLEIVVNIAAPVYAPAFGETVVLQRAGSTFRDRYGNTRRRYSDLAVAGCAVRVLGSSETVSNTADQVVTNVEVIMPPDVEVTAADRILVRGLLFHVNGEPTEVIDSMTGGRAGVRVAGLRQTG